MRLRHYLFFALSLTYGCVMGREVAAEELHPGHPAVVALMAQELHEEQWHKTQQLRAAQKQVDILTRQVESLAKRVEALEKGSSARPEARTAPTISPKPAVKPKQKPQ